MVPRLLFTHILIGSSIIVIPEVFQCNFYFRGFNAQYEAMRRGLALRWVFST
jgi:hypothetical protein